MSTTPPKTLWDMLGVPPQPRAIEPRAIEPPANEPRPSEPPAADATSSGAAGVDAPLSAPRPATPSGPIPAHTPAATPVHAATHTREATPHGASHASARPTLGQFHGHIAIEASAGSGKTHALATRYTALLLAGADPATILAATFTRKAAGEILARALRTVVSRVREGAPEEILRRVAHAGERLAVGTLDSFFARMASGLALDLRVAPHWEIADAEVDADLAQRTAERVIASLDTHEALNVVAALCSGRSPSSPMHAILRAVRGVEGEFDAASVAVGGDDAWLLSELPSPDTLPSIDASQRRQWADAILRVQLPTNKDGTPSKQISEGVRKGADCVRDGRWNDLIDGGVGARALEWVLDPSSGPMYYKHPVPIPLLDALKPCVEHARDRALAAFRAKSEATGRVLASITQAQQAARRREGLLRFSDVPELLIASASANSGLAFALDARVAHMLLDEFQDTSLVQFRLLLPLIDEIVSGASDEQSFFCVGDPKQSLYRWRGAEPELLRALTDRYTQITNQSLATNWRSSPVVLRATDLALAHRPDAPFHAEITSAFTHFHGHTPQRTSRPGAAALVEVSPEAPPPGPNAKPARLTAAVCADAIDAYVAQRVAQVRERAPWATVGILVRRNARVTSVLAALRDLGIAASEEAGSPLGNSPGVATIASLLHLTAFPSDSASYLHVALSPLAKRVGAGHPLDMRAARALSRAWRIRIARAGLARSVAALARAWTRALGDAHDASHQRARLDAAHELARAMESSGESDPAEFARILRTRPVPDDARAPVTVLTVHKAKGLEFDAVFAVELDEPWAKGRELVVERVDPQGRHIALAPIRRVFVRPSKEVEALAPSLRDACNFQRTRALGEDICGLYVTMTRAVHLLEMLIKPEESRDSINAARLLRQRLSGESGPPVDLPPLGAGVAGARAVYRDGLHENDAWAPAALIEREREAREKKPAASAAEAAPQRDVPLRLHTNTPPPAWRRPAASPSSLEGGTRVALGPIFAPRDDAPRRFGTLFHLWASLVLWLDDGIPDLATLLEVARANGLSTAADDTPARAAEFQDFLASPAATRVLSRKAFASHAGTLHVRTEWAYAAMVDDGGSRRLLRGQFDRVVWATDDSGTPQWAHIIDWKTDAAADDAAIAQRVEYYGPQIRAYRLSACALLGLTPDRIGASLVMIASRRVIDLS